MKAITTDEIKKVENILLPKEKTFGGETSERVNVIREISESCDIVACPGSGKTTVLLAKLLILANRMPFEDNRGICVLTHTNVAIDEIKKKAGIVGDKLFKYPNFFGTFQKFVDRYLAIPYNSSKYGIRLNKIGREHYLNECKKFFYNLNWSSNGEYSLRNSLYQEFRYRKDLNSSGKNEEAYKMFCDLRVDFFNKKITKGINGKTFRKANTKSINALKAYKDIINFKENLFAKGIADFEDCYSLALVYIDIICKISETFNNRFRYVFVDEMQDTDSHQLKIIEDLFEKTDTIIQYFGDPNQSIYDFSVKEKNVWKPGKNGRKILPISDSKRFGNEISCVLDKLKIDNSISLQSNSSNNTLKPKLLVYKQGEECEVLEKFVEIIHNKQHKWIKELNEKTPIYKAIGWIGKKRTEDEIDKGKLNISSYFPRFEKKSTKNKQVYENLKFYLIKNSETVKEKGAKIYHDSIINALLEVLDRSGVKRKVVVQKQIGREIQQIAQERSYTKTSFFEELEKKGQLKPLLRNIAKWSRKIHNSQEDYDSQANSRIKKYVKIRLLKIFKNINKSKVNEFLSEPEDDSFGSNSKHDENKGYIFKSKNPEFKDIPIEIGTVHSVKGETHTATLYMETSYHAGRNTLGHESERITDFLLNRKCCLQETRTYHKETLKMVHVGFSRPTHLLCFAVCEDRVNKDEIDEDEWKIIEV